jgi:Flp pilus assembly protein TadD
MSSLQPPDSHLLNAAVGWMELGNSVEARHELEAVSAGNQSHPDVLEARWSLCARERDWAGALAVAERLVAEAPDRCSGWINRSYTLHELKRTSEAREKLIPATPLFPSVSTIPYNLACYDCQLGQLDLARHWLNMAMNLGRRDEIRSMALKDPDLKPLWPELQTP